MKPKLALVKNPKSSLSLSGGTVKRRTVTKNNPSKTSKTVQKGKTNNQNKKRSYKKNPAPKAVYKYRTRRNPADTLGKILTTALFTGAFIVGYDWLTNKFLGGMSAPVRIGTKALAGLGVSQWGNKLPVVGLYSKEIGLILIALAVVDGLQSYVLPTVTSTVSGLMGGGSVQKQLPAPEQTEMSDDEDYDNYDDSDEFNDDEDFDEFDEEY